MRLDYINPFIDAAESVLSEVLDAEVTKGKLTLEKGIMPKKEIIVSFGLAGEISGEVIFEMSEDTVLNMAGRINGREFGKVEPFALDSMAEVSNIIVGRSITLLNDMGFNFYLTPPVVYTGKDLRIGIMGIETLVMPLSTPYGDVVVNVALKGTI